VRCEIESSGILLAGSLSRPTGPDAGGRGLVLCHGFPAGPGGARTSGQTYPELAERLAADTGWTVLTFNFRGTGASEGDFSLGGWLDDLRAAIDHLLLVEGVSGVWLAGFASRSSCRLADSHLRGPMTTVAQLDHLLSSVPI